MRVCSCTLTDWSHLWLRHSGHVAELRRAAATVRLIDGAPPPRISDGGGSSRTVVRATDRQQPRHGCCERATEDGGGKAGWDGRRKHRVRRRCEPQRQLLEIHSLRR